MPREISRATISSLKATHQAHRIASEILYPHVEQPISPERLPFVKKLFSEEPISLPRSKYIRHGRFSVARESILLAILIAVAASAALVTIYRLKNH